MYWIEEEVDGQKRDLSMWDFYQLYYRDFGQLLVNMENRGIFVSTSPSCPARYSA